MNAGTGRDVSVKELARLCASGGAGVQHVAHDHPQAEIQKLVCDSTRAKELLGWEAKIPLEEGLRRTRAWLDANRWAW